MSQQNDDFISFESALRDLQMQSEELKKLVSEGEIRAFRDGDSMKFRREDLESLRGESEDLDFDSEFEDESFGDDDFGGEAVEEELVFTEGLEDDTGMVTEELSEEDTLLADDDEEIEAELGDVASTAANRATGHRSARVRAQAAEEQEREPIWAIAAAVLCSALMLWALLICYDVSMGRATGVNSMFQSKTAVN